MAKFTRELRDSIEEGKKEEKRKKEIENLEEVLRDSLQKEDPLEVYKSLSAGFQPITKNSFKLSKEDEFKLKCMDFDYLKKHSVIEFATHTAIQNLTPEKLNNPEALERYTGTVIEALLGTSLKEGNLQDSEGNLQDSEGNLQDSEDTCPEGNYTPPMNVNGLTWEAVNKALANGGTFAYVIDFLCTSVPKYIELNKKMEKNIYAQTFIELLPQLLKNYLLYGGATLLPLNKEYMLQRNQAFEVFSPYFYPWLYTSHPVFLRPWVSKEEYKTKVDIYKQAIENFEREIQNYTTSDSSKADSMGGTLVSPSLGQLTVDSFMLMNKHYNEGLIDKFTPVGCLNIYFNPQYDFTHALPFVSNNYVEQIRLTYAGWDMPLLVRHLDLFSLEQALLAFYSNVIPISGLLFFKNSIQGLQTVLNRSDEAEAAFINQVSQALDSTKTKPIVTVPLNSEVRSEEIAFGNQTDIYRIIVSMILSRMGIISKEASLYDSKDYTKANTSFIQELLTNLIKPFIRKYGATVAQLEKFPYDIVEKDGKDGTAKGTYCYREGKLVEVTTQELETRKKFLITEDNFSFLDNQLTNSQSSVESENAMKRIRAFSPLLDEEGIFKLFQTDFSMYGLTKENIDKPVKNDNITNNTQNKKVTNGTEKNKT